MLSEYTLVCSKEKLNEKVEKGCIGVIVHVLDTDVFLVEFIEDNDSTIGVYTVSRDMIEEISSN